MTDKLLHEFNSIEEALDNISDSIRGYSLKSAWSSIIVIACIISCLLILLVACGTAKADEGVSSFYGNGERLNKHTANREVFNPADMTCATYQYPFNTLLRVTNLANGKSVIVRVNDRGPAKRLNRIIDLTRDAFKCISPLKCGIIKVSVEAV